MKGERIYKISSTIVLKSGSEFEHEDYLRTKHGMNTAAEAVIKAHMRLKYEDPESGEWSDVANVVPHTAQRLCDLTL